VSGAWPLQRTESVSCSAAIGNTGRHSPALFLLQLGLLRLVIPSISAPVTEAVRITLGFHSKRRHRFIDVRANDLVAFASRFLETIAIEDFDFAA
jgi:hypothetical protein